jgi:thiamine-phosphate pyrophosphorylase
MSRRQTLRHGKDNLPRIWLMTDLRFGDDLLPAIKRLPFRSGVIFRHYDLAAPARKTLFYRVKRICRQRGHMLLLAGDEHMARRWRADGFHVRGGSRRSRQVVRSAPVHNRREMAEAKRNGADMLLISAVFPTASHPDARTLGRSGLASLATLAGPGKVIALGGMTARKAITLRVHGWAGIDAFRKIQL